MESPRTPVVHRRTTRLGLVTAAAVLVSTIAVAVSARAVPTDPGPGPGLSFRPVLLDALRGAVQEDPRGAAIPTDTAASGEPGRTWPTRAADESLPPATPEPTVEPSLPPLELPGQGSVAATPAPAATTAGPRLRVASLGIDEGVLQYPCDRAAPPDDHVYRWGCAGRNNLYLLGHAASVFRALHDAYVAGRLQVGMTADWTDAGRSTTYHVTSWRLVLPTDTAWATAAQPIPSMTLQTCYGVNNEYRLLVRLVT